MKKKTKKTITYLLLFVLLLMAALAYFNHIDDDGDVLNNFTFSVEYDGKTYSGEDNEIVLPYSGQAEFEVNNASDYTVKVLPNVSFTFRTGSEIIEFSELDFTSVFDIPETENGFTINCDNDYSVYGVLQSMYSSSDITLPTIDDDINCFVLCIESSSGDVIRIAFKQVVFVAIEDIKLDKTELIF